MKTKILLFTLLLTSLASFAQMNYLEESETDMDKRMKWFTDAKYGMFIHFGLYSQLGGIYKGSDEGRYAEWIQANQQIPKSAISAEKDRISIQSLRCEYIENPLAINTSIPRFSWILKSTEGGQKQTAYQILVSSSEKLLEDCKSDLWDSGKVLSDETVGIVYAGAKLRSGQKCWWKIRVWDKNDC